jgi:DNA-binding LytR/AlgR family response regulator
MKGSKILIVEDEAIIAAELKQIVLKLGYDVIGVAHRYTDTIRLLQSQAPDLVLLDIGLDYCENDGIDLGAYINNTLKIPFIYLTANADEATVRRAKLTNPAAYILKPFNNEAIFSSIEIAMYKESNTHSIFIKQGVNKSKINCEKIRYLKADNMYTEIHTSDNKKYVIREYLTSFLSQLPIDSFVQVHRSYVVNFNFISSYTNRHIVLDTLKIPLSNMHKQSFLEFSRGK